jgi:hypothetical protein
MVLYRMLPVQYDTIQYKRVSHSSQRARQLFVGQNSDSVDQFAAKRPSIIRPTRDLYGTLHYGIVSYRIRGMKHLGCPKTTKVLVILSSSKKKDSNLHNELQKIYKFGRKYNS